MTIYSHSRLSLFEQCKYAYKLRYIDKVKVDVPATIEMFMGSCVHKALEKLYKDLKMAKLLNSVEDVVIFYHSVWDKEWDNKILIAKGDGKERYLAMGEKFIRNYYKEYAPFDQSTVVDVETQDRLRLKDGNFYHIRIDRLAVRYGTYYVCDYKTNAKMKSQEEADADRQLALYSHWVKQHHKDAKRVVLVWHMLAHNQEVVSERTDAQLRELEEKTVALIKVIEGTKEFPTSVTPLCSYCVYQSMCPEFKGKEKGEGHPTNKEHIPSKGEHIKLKDTHQKTLFS